MPEIVTVLMAPITAILTIILKEWFSDRKWRRDLMEKFNKLTSRLDDNDLTTKRVELLLYINTHPDKVEPIFRMMDEYKRLGGDGYIDEVFAAYKEERARKIVRERLKHGEEANE